VAHRLLLNVSSLMYRVRFAFGRDLSSPGGRPIGAVHGYLDITVRSGAVIPLRRAAFGLLIM
jgi:hypothetical protein